MYKFPKISVKDIQIDYMFSDKKPNYNQSAPQQQQHGQNQPFPNPPVRQGPPMQQAYLHTKGQQVQGYYRPDGGQHGYRGQPGQQRGYPSQHRDVASGPGFQGHGYQGHSQGHQGYENWGQHWGHHGQEVGHDLAKEQRNPRDNRKNVRPHRDSSSEDRGEMSKTQSEDDTPKTPVKNPFVPLQVSILSNILSIFFFPPPPNVHSNTFAVYRQFIIYCWGAGYFEFLLSKKPCLPNGFGEHLMHPPPHKKRLYNTPQF